MAHSCNNTFEPLIEIWTELKEGCTLIMRSFFADQENEGIHLSCASGVIQFFSSHAMLKEDYMELPFTIHNWLYLILSVVGLFALGSALRSKRLANVSQSWQGTQGQVIASDINKSTSNDSDYGHSTSYEAIIRYTYSVMGKDYTGERVNFGIRNTSEKSARETVARYPINTSVTVFYNPDKPEQAVMEQASSSGWLQIVIGIALFVAGIYFAIK
jgi:hypothetical protein